METNTQIKIKKLETNLVRYISKNLVNELDVEFLTNFIGGDIVAKIQMKIWAEELQKTKRVIKTPATWWDHFKQDILSKKIRRVFRLSPIKYKLHIIVFERNAIFPNLTLIYPEETKEFIYKETISERVDYE